MAELSKKQRKTLEQIKCNGFEFKEFDTRMNYGMIGHLTKNTSDGEARILVFPKCFYVKNGSMLPLNENNLKVIARVQRDFKNLRR